MLGDSEDFKNIDRIADKPTRGMIFLHGTSSCHKSPRRDNAAKVSHQ